MFSTCAAALYARSASRDSLRDGYVLKGVSGRLIDSDVNQVSLFEFDVDVNDVNNANIIIPTGTEMELLPSSTLEKMILDVNDHPDRSYRLWARISEYEDKHYLFPVYFLRTVEEKKPVAEEPNKTGDETGQTPETSVQGEPAVNEPNNILNIPQEVLDMLEARRTETAGRSQRPVDSNSVAAGKLQNTDSVLIDRAGRLVKGEDGKLQFVPDALGLNVSSKEGRFELLPCEALEQAWNQLASAPDSIRFKVSGITTKYEDRRYLLLNKAARIYSYGNFGR